jgi:HEPN domain-containing protein
MDLNHEIIGQWIQRAENDLRAAEILYQSDPLILDIACFHYQQSVEKYLKAFLILKGKEFLLSHNIEYLLDLCSEFDSFFSEIDPKNLSIFAVRARYPHDHFSPDKDEVEYYNRFTIAVRTFVLSKI